MSTLVAFLVAGVGTSLVRTSMVLADGRLPGSAWIERRLALVGPAVLAAIVASALFIRTGTTTLPSPAVVMAVLGALIAVRRTGNVSMALMVGLPIYWVGAVAFV